MSFVTHPSFVSCAIRCFGNGKRKYFFSTFGNESPIRKSNPETKVLLYRRNESRNEVRIRKSQTNKQSREWVHRLPEEIEAPSASSKTPACKTCFVLINACIVASVKAPAVSDVAASANIHTAECQQRWHKLAPSSDSLQYLKQLSSSRALLAAQDAPRLRIGPGQKSTAAARGH